MLTLTPKNNEETVKAEVIEIREETPEVKTFRLKPEKEVDFRPGQFVFLYLTVNNEKLRRAYSIASSPLEKGFLEITVKKEHQGKASTYLNDNVKTGDIFDISKAMGKFSYADEMKSIVLIAGGSGVVPFRSIIRYCGQKKLDTRVVLLYSTKTEHDIIYKREFEQIKDNRIKIGYTLTRDNKWNGHIGRIDAEFLRENVLNPKENNYFLCGPLEFIRAIVAILTEIGVDRANIKRDVWG